MPIRPPLSTLPLPVPAGPFVPITGGWVSGDFFPAVPPVQPYLLPPDPFDITIGKIGVRLGWGKSHSCPCSYYPLTSSPAGSPNPQCQTCSGHGVYWDPLVPFIGIISFGHRAGVRDEPGMRMAPDTGLVFESEPTLTLPYSAGNVWMECSEYDLILEVDSQIRYNAVLEVGGIQTLPYQQCVNVAATGAVTTWVPATCGVGAIQPVTGYTVSGVSVVIPDSYPDGTPYMVEFNASPVYVCFRIGGGFPHFRPFNQGQTAYPKRFHLTPLDLFLRGLPVNSA